MAIRSREFWATVEAYNRILKTKLCLAEPLETGCSSPIIKAHTIPRSQLRQIAVDSHVYTAALSLGDMNQNDGQLAAKRIGINEFSVLNCFCADHDKTIFADLEDQPLTYSPRQIALLQYRAAGAEFYKKTQAVELSEHNISAFSPKADAARLEMLHLSDYGERLGLSDSAAAFERTERELKSNTNAFSALVVFFSCAPTIMTVGAFLPEFDYDCRKLQTLGTEDECQAISYNILAVSGHASLCMTWLKGDRAPESFARSFVSQRPELYTSLAIQTAFEHLENTCMNPTWWDALRPAEQRLLLRRMRIAGSYFEERKPSCLSFSGVKHDDWGYGRYEFINT